MTNPNIPIRRIESAVTLVANFPRTLGECNAREDKIMQQPPEDYHSTLSGAVDEIVYRLLRQGAVPADPNWRDTFSSLPLYRAQSHRTSFELASLRGKLTKKFFHVNLYRLDSGRYELNTYIL